MAQEAAGSRWFPTVSQLKDPVSTERSFRQVLNHVYELQDKLSAMQPASGGSPTGPPAGSGPSDSMLLGLRVAPVDVQTLADGATLKFSKKDGNFKFS